MTASPELYNSEAEARVLAAIVRNPEKYWEINEVGLHYTDFLGKNCRAVMRAIEEVVGTHSPELPFIIEELRAAGKDEFVDYATKLEQTPSGVEEASEYARIVKGLSVSRKIAEVGVKFVEVAREKRQDYESAIADAEHAFRSVRDEAPTSERSPEPADILRGMWTAGDVPYIPIRFSPTLQDYTGGLAPGNLWVVGAFSSVGKSAVGVNIAESVLREGDKWVGIMSLEMNREDYMIRLLSLRSGIPQRRIRRREQLDLEETDRLNEAKNFYSSANLRVYDNAYTIRDIRSKAKMMKETCGLDVLIVDFIQNVSGSTGDEVKDAREVIIDLQHLAKDLGCTVIAFSQISNDEARRQADSTTGGIYNFKGHGAIKDAADVGIMLSRNLPDNSPTLYMNVVKNRHDEKGLIVCKMELKTGRIKEIIDFDGHQYDIPDDIIQQAEAIFGAE